MSKVSIDDSIPLLLRNDWEADPIKRAIGRASIVSITDAKGTITYVNELFEHISGYSASELVGRTHHVINSGFHLKTFWSAMWKAISKGESWRGEVKNRAKDGSYYWVDTFVMPLLDDQGKVKEYLSIRNDITSRKELEEANARMRNQLSETLVFGKMGSAMLDLETLKVDFSAELLLLLDFGHATEQITLGLAEALKKFVPEEHAPVILDKIKSFMSGDTRAQQIVELDLPMITKTGRRIFVEVKIMFKDRLAFGIVQDVTEGRIAFDEGIKKSKTINTILNGITDGFFAIDREMRFLMVSPVFAALAQMPREHMEGKTILELFPFMEHSPLYATYQKCLATGKSLMIEHKSEVEDRKVYEINIYPNSEGLFVYYKDVSVSKRAEEDLGNTNELFKRLSENVPGMIYNCYLDKEEQLIFPFASSGAERLLGIPAKWLMEKGSLILDIVHPDDLDYVVKSIKTAFYSNSRWSCEFRITNGKGETRWIAGDSNPYFESKGNYFWYGFMYDITERKLSEQRVAESELKNRLIIENSGEGILFTSPNGEIFSANPEACRIFGMTEEEIIKVGRSGLIDEHDPVILYGYEHRKEKGFFHGEIPMRRKDGTYFPAEITSKLFTSPDGLVKSSLIVRDISERKTAEEEVRRLALIASKTSNIVILTDARGDITWVNDAFERITEYTRSEVIGKNPGDLLQGPATDRSTIEFMGAALNRGEGFKTEILNFSKSKRPYWLDIEVIPVHNSKGDLSGFMAIETDITQLKSSIMEQELARHRMKQMYDELNAVLNSSSDSTFFLDPDYRIRVFNQTGGDSVKKIYGRELKRGDSMLELAAKGTEEDFKKNFARALAGELVTVEREIPFNEKINVWTQVRYLPVYDENRQIVGVSFNSTDITHRKIAEHALFESRNYFQSLVHSQSNFLIRTNSLGYLTFVNFKFCERFCVDEESLIGRHLSECLIPQNIDVYYQVINSALADPGKVMPVTLNVKREYGEVIPTAWEFVALLDEAGRLSSIQAVGLDISEQVASQLAVQKANARLQMAAQLAGIGAWEWELATGNLVWDDALYSILGFNKADGLITIARFDQCVYPQDMAKVYESMKELRPDNNVFSGIFRMKRPDNGQLRYINFICAAEFDSDGKIFKITGVDYDVTEQELSTQVIRESEERFRMMADTAPVFIWMSDPNNNTTFLSKTWYDFTNSTPELELGKGWLRGIHPDDAVAAGEACMAAFNARAPLYMEYRLKRYDGVYRWMIDTGVPRYLETGEFIGYIGSCFDITERKESEEQLVLALAEKEVLIKEIHHRIKNNLQLISSMLYIKMSAMAESDIKTFLHETRQKIRSIALIHERLLQTESVSQVEISDYMQKLIEDIKLAIHYPHLKLIFKIDLESAMAELDTAIYCGLIVNELITNSIKHAFVGRHEGNITLKLKQIENGLLELTVSDDGSGMGSDVAPGKTNSFGMQMIDIFVKQLSGQCEIDRSQGTRFTITFGKQNH